MISFILINIMPERINAGIMANGEERRRLLSMFVATYLSAFGEGMHARWSEAAILSY